MIGCRADLGRGFGMFGIGVHSLCKTWVMAGISGSLIHDALGRRLGVQSM